MLDGEGRVKVLDFGLAQSPAPRVGDEVSRGWLEHDSNLDSIRSHPRFAELMLSLAEA